MENPCKKRKIIKVNRKFQEAWTLKYFFIEFLSKPTCLLCRESIATVKECNVQRHYATRHQSKYDTLQGPARIVEVDSLKKKFEEETNVVPKLFRQQTRGRDNIVHASYKVAYLIAREQQALCTGEFVKKCMEEVVKEIAPEKLSSIQEISLSRRTITRRILDIGENLESQLEGEIAKFRFYSLAMDESTDVGDTAQLLIFVRGIDDNFNITEELASLQSMKDRTTGEDIFNEIVACVEKLKLPWPGLCGITTDGAPSMVGPRIGAVARINQLMRSRNLVIPVPVHCLIHLQVLCSKILDMKHVMDIVVKIVNFIRARGLNHRQFKEFVEEVGCEQSDVVYHNNVRWLSRAKVLERFFDMLEVIEIFLVEKRMDVPQLSNPNWLFDLAFLTDICGHCNTLNQKLQKQGRFIYELLNDVNAFQGKLNLLTRNLEQQNYVHLPACSKIQKKVSGTFPGPKFIDVLKRLQNEYGTRFEDVKKKSISFRLVENPFETNEDDVAENLQMELIDLKANTFLRDEHTKNRQNLQNFYRLLPADDFPQLRAHAQRIFCMFGSTYTCEETFSKMKFIKSAHRSRLTDEHLHVLLRSATSNFTPDLMKLVQNVQTQVSH